jgi:hypothetical protein
MITTQAYLEDICMLDNRTDYNNLWRDYGYIVGTRQEGKHKETEWISMDEARSVRRKEQILLRDTQLATDL